MQREMRGDPMPRTIAIVCVALMLVGGAADAFGQAPAGKAAPGTPDPWFVRTTRVQFQPQRAYDAPVQVDLPRKDWAVLPSSGSGLLTLVTRKLDAMFSADQTVLRQELTPADITDLFGQIETEAIKERSPKASQFESRVIDTGGRRLVVVQYVRPGALGTEKVRQYSIPAGKALYRLTCVAPAAQFAAFDATCAHMAASFSVGP